MSFNPVAAVEGMSTIQADGAAQAVYLRRNPDTGNIEYAINTGIWVEPSFPVSILNTNAAPTSNMLRVIFTTPLTLTADNQYFACSSNGIQFGIPSLTAYTNGGMTIYDRASITIDGVTDYPGLIQNGTAIANGFSNIYVYNLSISATNASTLEAAGGWIGQQNFGSGAANNYFINCTSSGDINSGSCGGIVGGYAGNNTGATLYIIGCSSSGAIGASDINVGGIVGGVAGGSGGHVECIQCWSSGNIGSAGGGIFGDSAGTSGGYAEANKCYSNGAIGGEAGGIFGQAADATAAYNCYSIGDIASLGGGIYGVGASGSATNCYSAGAITTSGNGIFGSSSSGTQLHCYPANGSWSNAAANAALTGTPSATNVGSTWAIANPAIPNQPYSLALFGPTPYSTIVISSNALVQNYAQTIIAGNSAIKAVKGDASGNNFRILQISTDPGTIIINKDTGVISTTTATPPATYVITVYSVGSYQITTFTLTVGSPTLPLPCCAPIIPQPMLPYGTIEDNTIGTLLIQERAHKPTTQFTTYTDYIKYKMAQSAYRTA